jgi:diguanylate cyclase (GGDEF)-like protein
MLLGWSSVSLRAEPAPLKNLAAVTALTNAEAGHAFPVAFEATVTYFRDYEKTMFVQDGDAAIYVQATTPLKLLPGDRILVRGTTRPSFRPFVLSSDITLLRHGAAPDAVPASFEDLIHARLDCRRVKVRGIVQTADISLSSGVRSTVLQLFTDGGEIDIVMDSDNASALSSLLDAEVEVTGAVSGRFDGKMQITGVVLHAPSLADLKIVKSAAANPWGLPITPMDQILSGFKAHHVAQRIRVQGTVTYYQPGSAVVLQNGPLSLWISTRMRNDLQVNDIADATGFPDVHDGFLKLTSGEFETTHARAPIKPQPVTWNDLSLSHNIFDLVSIEGKVVTAMRESGQDEYVIMAGNNVFSAIVRHPAQISLAPAPLPPLKQIPVGSTVLVSGVCILEDSNPFNSQVPFDILMRSFDDITVVAKPAWVSVSNLVRLMSLLIAMMLAVFAWGWTLRRKVFHQTAALARQSANEAARERHSAELQRRRSRILEDINGTRPLAEILEEITSLVSYQLKGPPCWCEITDGARLGIYPANVKHLHVASDEIRSRSGPPLGTLFAAFLVPIKADGEEHEFLTVGAQLATLAIETRRLYTDLVRRSEFDLLTDIHNRFSLEKQLDTLIGNAREHATTFGIVYVDLDEFKQVNDLYGHRVGDLYLQDVALRMMRQLRASDVLARLGGDEFAALMPAARTRAEVEEIAQRLEACFKDPFSIDGYVLRGSASFGIALYPEDGATKDSLLSAADASMYVAKHTKRPVVIQPMQARARGPRAVS